MSQIRGKTEDSAEDVVIYGEAEPEVLKKIEVASSATRRKGGKLAKGPARAGPIP